MYPSQTLITALNICRIVCGLTLLMAGATMFFMAIFFEPTLERITTPLIGPCDFVQCDVPKYWLPAFAAMFIGALIARWKSCSN